MTDELICESCGLDCEELIRIMPYDGQEDIGWICSKCLEELS